MKDRHVRNHLSLLIAGILGESPSSKTPAEIVSLLQGLGRERKVKDKEEVTAKDSTASVLVHLHNQLFMGLIEFDPPDRYRLSQKGQALHDLLHRGPGKFITINDMVHPTWIKEWKNKVVMRHLEKGPSYRSEMEKTLHISNPTISDGIQELVSRGMAIITPGTKDGKKVHLVRLVSGNSVRFVAPNTGTPKLPNWDELVEGSKNLPVTEEDMTYFLKFVERLQACLK